MKKNYLILLLSFTTLPFFGQFSTLNFSDGNMRVTGFDHQYNEQGRVESLDLAVTLLDEDEIPTSGNYTFDDYYYKFKFRILGNSGHSEMLAEVTPNKISPNEVCFTFTMPNYWTDSFMQGHSDYRIELIVEYYRLTGYPGMMSYVHWSNYRFITRTFDLYDTPTNPGGDDGGSDPDEPDEPDESLPDLVISSAFVETSLGSFNVKSGEKPVIYGDEATYFQISIQNNSEVNSASTTFISKLESASGSHLANLNEKNIPPLLNGQTEQITDNYYISLDMLGGYTLYNGRDYEIEIEIDNLDLIDEGAGEDNNTLSFEFTYQAQRRSLEPIKLQNGMQYYDVESPNSNSGSFYTLTLYDPQTGGLVFSQPVQSGANVDISHLPGSVYAVHLNNEYIKQIHLLKHSSGF